MGGGGANGMVGMACGWLAFRGHVRYPGFVASFGDKVKKRVCSVISKFGSDPTKYRHEINI